jgi:putative Holliday junction resolvase
MNNTPTTPFPGRLLGIDHGTKVIGLATCDRIGLLATPYKLIVRKSRQEDFAQIQAFIEAEGIVGVVVGLPPRPPDFVGTSQADIVKKWARRLARAVSVPIYFWDEGLSSVDAASLLHQGGQRLPARIDAQAAAVILQSFLDAIREGMSFPEPIPKT